MINFYSKIKVLIIAFILLPLMSCAVMHRYGAYHGKVVDAETNEPLGGAAVVAVYYTESSGFAGVRGNYLDAQETLTDKNGEFNIPPFVANTLRIGHSFRPHAYFRIFKPGYGCYPRHKDVEPMFVPNGTLPENEYVIIELPMLQTREERLRNYGCHPYAPVPETKYTNLFNLIQQERKALGLKPEKMRE